MATKYFLDTLGTGNLATAGNWDSAALPSAGDDAIVQTGTNDLFGDLSAINLNSFKLTPGWTGTQFGTISTPVTIQASGAGRVVDIEMGPRCYLARIAAGTTITRLRVTGTGSGQVVLTSGTFTTSEVVGQLLVGASAVCTTHYGLGGNQKAEAGTAFTTIYVDSGCSMESARDTTTAYVSGILKNTVSAASTLVIASAGGVFNLQSDGTQAAVHATRNGAFSLEGSKRNATVTNLYDHYGSARCDRTGKGISLTTTYVPVGKTG